MSQEQRLLGRLVAIDMTPDATTEAGKTSVSAASTYQYTTIDGQREIDRADNGDHIP